MRIIAFILGERAIDKEADARKAEVERQTEHARGRLRDAVQNIESGSRVLKNMAGMMTLMNLNSRLHENDR